MDLPLDPEEYEISNSGTSTELGELYEEKGGFTETRKSYKNKSLAALS